jgi:hypothetical protein
MPEALSLTVAERHPDAVVIVPPRSTPLTSLQHGPFRRRRF